MRILTVCDQGNNRSVQFAHLLKYWDNDVIACGVLKNSPETLNMLFTWAEKIIITAQDQVIPEEFKDKVVLFDIGPDIYKRPFNPELHAKAKQYLEENKLWLKQ